MRKTSSDSLTPEPQLEMLDPMLESETYGASEDPKEPLSEIIQFLNDEFGEDAPAAREMVNEVFKDTARDVGVSNAVRTNPLDKARLTVDEVATAGFTRRHATNFRVYRRISDDEHVRNRILDRIFEAVVKKLRNDNQPGA